MPLVTGTRLGPYEILSALGSGGMGEVYRARDIRLDRTVAIKILSDILAADPPFRERFDREARAISQLTHPHICTLYDVGEQRGTAFLVMEYLAGETLERRLQKSALPLNEALRIAIQIADALSTAHRHGIVHRDLKPGNVMLTKGGAKLLDFGLAKASAPSDSAAGAGPSILLTTPPNVTSQGTILGTFQYMAPEQVEGRDADARTDIFAFGCVLYEMLTGQKAFEGRTHASLIGAIMHAEPVPVAARQPLVPRALDRVLRKCLAKDPDARWQTVRDLHDELTWIADERVSSPPPNPASARVVRPRVLVAWLLAAVAMTAVVAGAVWNLRRLPAPLSVMRFEVPTPASSDLTSFALSPDGEALVFAAPADGAAKLWVRRFDHTTAVPLAGTEGASFPFWSPDGRAIGFFAEGKLKRVDIAGRTPQVLADAPVGRGGTWSSDGVILFAPTGTAAERTPLMRVAAVGGTPTPATHFVAGQVNHRWPQFLPDGRRFIFLSVFGPPDANGVYLGSLDGREPVRLLAADSAALLAPPNRLLVVRQGVLRAIQFDPDRGTVSGDEVPMTDTVGTDTTLRRSALSVSPTGVLAYRPTAGGQRRQLVWVDRTGKQLATIGAPDDDGLVDPGIDPSGRWLVVSRFVGGKGDVWLMDQQRGSATRLTFDPMLASNPIWSADGRRVFFFSTRGGGASLFETLVSGQVEERLLLRDGGMPLSASRDGRFALYARTNPGLGDDVWALPLAGDDRKPFPVLQTTADERAGQFSPDGRWIAYESNESGRFEIYIRSFPTAGVHREVSTTGGTQPRWRHDGKELYYIAPDARLMAVSVTASGDGQPLDAGAPVPLFPTRLATGRGLIPGRSQYAVAADGRFLLNTAIDEPSAPPITLVLNWSAQVRD